MLSPERPDDLSPSRHFLDAFITQCFRRRDTEGDAASTVARFNPARGGSRIELAIPPSRRGLRRAISPFVQTLDPATTSPDAARSSPAATRNLEPILKVLRAHLPASGAVLEVASGTGQHAAAFAAALPGVDWTPSDPSPEARDSVEGWRTGGPPNLLPCLPIDVLDETTWPDATFKAVFCANMIHIAPPEASDGLMRLAGRVLTRPGGLLVLYGPFLEPDVETAASNLDFDVSLKSRDASWGLRDRNAVIATAREHGLDFTLRKAMPANNLTLLFRAWP
jgi:SAM-dependent methyltransferase